MSRSVLAGQTAQLSAAVTRPGQHEIAALVEGLTPGLRAGPGSVTLVTLVPGQRVRRVATAGWHEVGVEAAVHRGADDHADGAPPTAVCATRTRYVTRLIAHHLLGQLVVLGRASAPSMTPAVDPSCLVARPVWWREEAQRLVSECDELCRRAAS